MKFGVAVFKAACWMLKRQGAGRQVDRLEKEGKIPERDALVNEKVVLWSNAMLDIVGSGKNVVNVKGIENIPTDTAVVYIANHQSYLDIPLLMAGAGRSMGFIAKYETLKVPLLSSWMKRLRCIFMKRQSPRQSVESMNRGVETVKKGYSMVIFPEGHRSRCNKVQEYHAGSFKLAFRAEVPIIPVTIDGSYHMFEEKKEFFPATVNLTFHEPVPTAGLTREEQSAIPEKVFSMIRSKLPNNGD